MSRPQKNLADGWSDLLFQVERGKPIPKTLPTSLSFQRIKTRPAVFQHRQPAKHASKAHVRELVKALGRAALDPLTVWWDGKAWVCIDGHHRLEAYRQARQLDDIPVTVFEGSPEAATLHAAVCNTQAKLQMAPREKTNTAWRLVVTTDFSKAATVKASGASDGIVGQMRRVCKQLRTQNVDPASMRWQEARQRAAGEKPGPDVDWDAERMKRAQELANKLTPLLGKGAGDRSDILAEALEIIDVRLPGLLREYWEGHDEEDFETEL